MVCSGKGARDAWNTIEMPWFCGTGGLARNFLGPKFRQNHHTDLHTTIYLLCPLDYFVLRGKSKLPFAALIRFGYVAYKP